MHTLRRTGSFFRAADGNAAVEFALIVPVFVAVLFGIIVYGSYFALVHGVQQLTAEAARAAVAGLTDGERLTLAEDNIAQNVSSYPMVAPDRLSVETATTDAATGTFKVTVQYDASNMFVFNLPAFVPAPNPVVVRTAAIQKGGY